MGTVSVAAIIAGTAIVFVMCCVAIARVSFGETMTRANLHVAIYRGAVFAVALFGCLAVTQTAGAAAAGAFSLILCAASLGAGWFLERSWKRSEEAEIASIDELRRLVESYRDSSDDETSAQRCARAARAFDLTRREEVMLVLLLEGKTRAEIAGELYVSENTVKTHIRNLYRKMGVAGKAELVEAVDGQSLTHQ